ncbi:MAG: TetR/AcrR family transcriptional regulator C-terminal domain-containing protein [Actinomycetota bacterium]
MTRCIDCAADQLASGWYFVRIVRENPTPKIDHARVVAGAVELADGIGVDALTMRKLAEHLGTKPMTIYHYVANKEAIIDGMVDAVVAEIELPRVDEPWRPGVERRARSARDALVRHRWAAPLIDSRRHPGPATLRHHDTMIGIHRHHGFDLPGTAHSIALTDAYVYGFALQQANLPATGGDEMAELADDVGEQMPAGQYPHLEDFMRDHALAAGYEFGDEFETGLAIVLDGIEASFGP